MKNIPFYCLFSVFFLISSCASDAQMADGKTSIAEFTTKLAATSNPQLIDVRTPEEFSRGTLDGAKNINFNAPDFEMQINKLDKTQPVFIFCQAGGRSGKSYKKMKDLGFSEVYDMEGGYGKWSKQ